MPADLKQHKLLQCSLDITKWNGKGFMLNSTTMTPALVGNSQQETGEEIGVTPGFVSLDLDKENSIVLIPRRIPNNFPTGWELSLRMAG
jgi:hypothetical protein